MNKRKQISSYYSVSEEKMSTKQKASEVTFSPAKKINCLNTDKYDHHDSQQGWNQLFATQDGRKTFLSSHSLSANQVVNQCITSS